MPPILAAAYFFACFLIALLGKNRKMGAWGYFFASIVLTPPIGLLLVLASDSKNQN